MSKREWLDQNRAVVRILVGTVFLAIGLATAVVAYFLEKHGATNPAEAARSIDILIVGLVMPMAFSVGFVTILAVEWLVDRPRRDINVIQTFPDAIKFAEFRRDTVLKIEKLADAIYCTSHCNLFAYPSGREVEDENDKTLTDINSQFFRKVASLSMESLRGGLKLLLYYGDDDLKVRAELRPRFDIFLDVCESPKRDFSVTQFDVRRLLQESLKDYLVIEDHVFKVIRKTRQAGSEVRYAYVKNQSLADEYRVWLKDIFENGDGEQNQAAYTEKTKISRLCAEIKQEVKAEREKLKQRSY